MIDPKPYLITEAFACVAAGVTTLVSSLPSIIVGEAGKISFLVFSMITLPYMVAAIPISLFYLRYQFRKDLQPPSAEDAIDLERISFLDEWAVVSDRRMFVLAVLVMSATVFGFVVGGHELLAFFAIAGGTASLVLLTNEPLKVLKEIHWDTLIFFIGLFVLVGSLEQAGVLQFLAQMIALPGTVVTFLQIPLVGGRSFNILTIVIVVASVAIFSALLDNIPLTAAMTPVVKSLIGGGGFASGGVLWFSLLFGATFGGGFTPLGTAPSVIVMTTMRQEGHPIGFFQFVKLMAPLSTILLVIGIVYLLVLFYLLETFTIPL